MKKSFYLILAFSIFVSACASQKYAVSPDWDKSKLAKVHIYRSNVSFHSANPEEPYFYLDDKKIGTLGTGEAVTIEVQPGKHTITVKEPFMFMPTYESGRLEIDVKEKGTYYVRYSKDASGIVSTGGTTTVTGKTTIHIATKEHFMKRQ